MTSFSRRLARLLLPALMLLAEPALAQAIAPTHGLEYPVLGRVRPRAAKQIVSSPWSIGGETLDRDFAVYENYRRYLGPLGAKAIRLQAGWAKCERTRSVYAWEWLDRIIDDARAQGVQPWLELSYGNPLYAGGGDTGLGGGFPSSTAALAAWDRWARALVERYRDRVHEWEIWNEPDINKTGSARVEAYLELYLRTATMIRTLQPRSRIWALGLAGNLDYADKFLAGMKTRGKLALVDAITIHGYPRNPDDTTNIDRLRAIIARHGATIQVRQGETGAPSQFQESFALAKIPWSETTQAKWDLRRLLAHRAKDVPMNLFTICDLHYNAVPDPQAPVGALRMNYKGLLATNPDQTISRAKPGYVAAQVVFTIFDDTLSRIADFPFHSDSARSLHVSGYRSDTTGAQVVAIWFNDAPPAEANDLTPCALTFATASFREPVLVEIRTNTAHALPTTAWSRSSNGTTFRALPVYDSPILIAERALLNLDPIR